MRAGNCDFPFQSVLQHSLDTLSLQRERLRDNLMGRKLTSKQHAHTVPACSPPSACCTFERFGSGGLGQLPSAEWTTLGGRGTSAHAGGPELRGEALHTAPAAHCLFRGRSSRLAGAGNWRIHFPAVPSCGGGLPGSRQAPPPTAGRNHLFFPFL